MKQVLRREIINIHKGIPVVRDDKLFDVTLDQVEFKAVTPLEYTVICHLVAKGKVEPYQFVSFHEREPRTWGNLSQAINTMIKLLPGFDAYVLTPLIKKR